MSIVDKLLQLDSDKLAKKPKKDVPMPRLSQMLGEDAVFVCQAVDGERYAEIQRSSVNLNKKGVMKDFNLFDMQVLTVLDGVVEPNLKDKALMEHFGVVTPKELVKKMLLAGEIAELYTEISELSGYERDDNEEEIKN